MLHVVQLPTNKKEVRMLKWLKMCRVVKVLEIELVDMIKLKVVNLLQQAVLP